MIKDLRTQTRIQKARDDRDPLASVLLIDSLDYREVLNARIREIKNIKPGFGLVRLCEKVGLHSSYISAALKGQKVLSSDQMYLLSQALGFHDKEIDHLLLLLNYERAQDLNLKAKYLKTIEQNKKNARKSESHLSAKIPEQEDLNLAKYYSNPLYKVIHVFLSSDHYKNKIPEIKNIFNLSDKAFEEILVGLEDVGVISRTPEIKILKKNYHLPKDFFLCKPHQSMIKTLSHQKQMTLPDDKKETVCVTFSASKEDYSRIHAEFLEFLKRAESIVKKSTSDEVYQMIFDLHYWS